MPINLARFAASAGPGATAAFGVTIVIAVSSVPSALYFLKNLRRLIYGGSWLMQRNRGGGRKGGRSWFMAQIALYVKRVNAIPGKTP